MANCPRCGYAVSPLGVFCPKCGADLKSAPSAEAVVAAVEDAAPAVVVDAAPLPPDLPSGILSLNGRTARGGFWIFFAIAQGISTLVGVVVAVGSLAFGVAQMPGDDPASLADYVSKCIVFGALAGLPLNLAVDVFRFPLYVRRWHDLGRSGWRVCLYNALGLLPFLGVLAYLVQFLVLGCAAGPRAVNRFGRPRRGPCAVPAEAPAAYQRENPAPLWLCFALLSLAHVALGVYGILRLELL